jgi:hypothetical protein
MLTRTEYSTTIKISKIDFAKTKTTLNQPTGNFFYDRWEIKPEFVGTVWEELLKSLPVEHGEARVIVMEPGTTYMAHSDIDNRYHLSLQGERSYLIDLDNDIMHLLEQDGYWYEMDAGRIHVATNFGSYNRVQLVVRKLLVPTTMTNLVDVTIRPKRPQHDYRYKFDNIVSPWLNRTNSCNLIKDFSFEGEVVKFKTTMIGIATLNLTEDFEIEVVSVS